MPGEGLGEPSYNFTSTGQLAGGTLTVEGSAQKYVDASQQIGVQVTYRSTLAHEAGHAVGNLVLQKLGPLGAKNHCDERCALGPTNAYRADVGLPPLFLKR